MTGAARGPAALERVDELLLGGPRRYTRAEVAQRSGVPLEQTLALWHSLGFADVADTELAFTDDDVLALRTVHELTAAGLADPRKVHAIARLLGQSFARLAAAQLDQLAALLGGRPDAPEHAVELLAGLVPRLQHVQEYVWRRQLAAALGPTLTGPASTRPTSTGPTPTRPGVLQPAAAPVAVGFADLAGFTALTRRVGAAELDELLEAFESLSTEVVAAYGGRVVKTIGDEVLFVTASAPAAGDIALALVAADERLPPVRAGLAFGPVVGRLGDVYGSTVNIASRLTSLARPGTVLVDRELSQALRADPGFRLTARRTESVRGFAHLRSWRLRRGDGAGAVVTDAHRATDRSAHRR
jgi:adenylate cyclase